MRSTMRRRSFLRGIRSISLTAEGLMRISNRATTPQVLHDVLERQIELGRALVEHR